MAIKSIEDEIQELKKKHNALILAHYYEESEIQEIADHVGDSLKLAQLGQQAQNPVVLLAGVTFMGESVKILSPDKTVLIPDIAAGCSLVHSSPFEKYLQWRKNHPRALAVTYVNSSAEVKAISDVICTSSNAEKIINSIPKDREILFGPDQHLGRFISKQTDRPMMLWDGSCEVHVLFSAKKLFQLKTQKPNAVVLAHPECPEDVLQYADIVGSTTKLLNEAMVNPANEFIITTEPGIIHQMKKNRPDAEYIEAPAEGNCACNNCPYMKLNTLEKIRDSLLNLSPKIELNFDLLKRAQTSLTRMMDITDGKSVTWPDKFKDFVL